MGASGAALNAPGNSQTADQVLPEVGRIGTVEQFYDPTAFASVNEPRFGNTGRNILRGPSQTNLDFALFRKFPITEGTILEFRAEAFNLTNTPHFNNPVSSVESVNFMRIISAADTSRQFRFGLRLEF